MEPYGSARLLEIQDAKNKSHPLYGVAPKFTPIRVGFQIWSDTAVESRATISLHWTEFAQIVCTTKLTVYDYPAKVIFEFAQILADHFFSRI